MCVIAISTKKYMFTFGTASSNSRGSPCVEGEIVAGGIIPWAAGSVLTGWAVQACWGKGNNMHTHLFFVWVLTTTHWYNYLQGGE